MAPYELPHGYLGAQSQLGVFGMSAASHANPEIATGDTTLEVAFKTTKPVRMTAQLLECGADFESDKPHPQTLVFVQKVGDKVTMTVQLPSAGWFKLQCFAGEKPEGGEDQKQKLLNVFNYMIQANNGPRHAPVPFPKQYAQWRDGCYLHEPFTIPRGVDAANFKMTVPRAEAVAVTVTHQGGDAEWHHLNRQGDVFEGKVPGLLGKPGAPLSAVSLNANFPEEADKTKYSMLLDYPVQ